MSTHDRLPCFAHSLKTLLTNPFAFGSLHSHDCDRIIRATFMDPAKEEPLRSAMEMQGVMLGRHEEELSAARLAVEGLTAQVTDLSSRLLMLYQDPSADPAVIHSMSRALTTLPVMLVSLLNAGLF